MVDQSNPDVLFHSIFNRMSTTPNYRCKKVLILAENWRPKQFGSHYSVSFDPPTETNFRLPLWQMYWLLKPEFKDRLFNRKRWEEFERFCAFVVSNSSNMLRMNHFDTLNQYKKVHAYGKARMNDTGLMKASQGKYWRDAKDEFFLGHPHKYMMTYENTAYPGYCTEKLMDAFLVGALPIYWGDPRVEEDWNGKAFINAMKHALHYSTKSWLDIIKESGTFEEMYNEPVFTDEQKSKHLANIEEFENWLINVVKS